MTNPSDSQSIVDRIPDAVRRDPILYLAGHVGTVDSGRSPLDAARQMFVDLQQTLDREGFRASDVVWTVVYIADFADFDALNAAWDEFFPQRPPARTAISAGFGSPSVRFELTGIAHASA